MRLGVDTNGDSNIDQYVNPGGVPGNAAVVSATIWLLVRAEDRDFGHRDQTVYQYADMPGVHAERQLPPHPGLEDHPHPEFAHMSRRIDDRRAIGPRPPARRAPPSSSA